MIPRALLLTILAIAPSPAALAAKRGPDLVVISVAVTTPSPEAGRPIGIAYKVRNSGNATARATQISFYLAVAQRRASSDTGLGTRTVPALKKGRASKGKAIVTAPAAVGLFTVIACIDDERRVREVREDNNCTPTRTDVRISVPPRTQ